MRLTLEASAAERRALAARFDLVALDSLSADLRLDRIAAGDLVKVGGRVTATLAQRCVVTLEPAPAMIGADFERVFTQDAPEYTGEEEIEIGADDPEPLAGDTLDLGEIVAEELALALDPYPRSPAADQALQELGVADDGRSAHPFGALARLRGN